MENIWFIIILIGIVFINTLRTLVTARQMAILDDFKVDRTLIDNTMNGKIAGTVNLQTAADKARLANKTLFIPKGLYRISNTIECTLDIGCPNGWKIIISLPIVLSPLSYPVIKLADNLTDINGAYPMAVFFLSRYYSINA